MVALKRTFSPLWQNGRGWVLVLVAAGWMLSFGVRMTFPAMLPHIRGQFGLTLTESGLILTVLWSAFGIMQFPGGLLGDKLGERNVLVSSTFLSIAGIFLLALASSRFLFYLGTALFGLATGLFAVPRLTVLTNTFTDHDSTAIGITSASGNLGNTVLPISAGMLAVYFSWRIGFLVTLPLFVITAIGLWKVIPEFSSSTPAKTIVSRRTAGRLRIGLKSRRILLSGTALMAMAFTYQGLTGFYPTYLVLNKGFSGGVATTIFGLFFGVSMVMQILAGIGATRFGSRPILITCSGFAVVGLAMLPFVNGLANVIVLTVFMAAAVGFWPVVSAYMINWLPADIEGGALGFVRTVQQLLGSGGPLAVGVMADAGLFDSAFLLLAGVGVLALVLCLLLPD